MTTLALLLAVLSQSQQPVDTVADFEVVACTKDGTRLLYFGNDGWSEGSIVYFAVLDLRTARREVFDAVSVEISRKTWRRAFASAKRLKARGFEWVDCHASRTSPDGASVAELVPQTGVTAGTWATRTEVEMTDLGERKVTRETWRPNGSFDWQLSRKTGDVVIPLATSDSSDRITVYWTPGGERLIWKLHVDPRAMRDPGSDWFLVTAADGPALEVVASRLPTSKDEALLRALDAKDSRLVSWRQLRKRIDETVLEFTPGFEAQARALAERLPGTRVEAAATPGLVPLRLLLASTPEKR